MLQTEYLTESKNEKNFSNETIEKILERDGMRCRACGRSDKIIEIVPHHIFFKSQLFYPCVSRPENGAVICKDCHRMIHFGSNDYEGWRGKAIDAQLKKQAIEMFEELVGTEITADAYEMMESLVRRSMYEAARTKANNQRNIVKF